jgi:hypothetical protein
MSTLSQSLSQDVIETRKIIDKLPQRRMIKDADIENWIEGILAVEPERLIWHAKRCGSFGGSDIGTLVADFYNKERFESIFTHQKPRDIIAAKLLKAVPSVPKEEAPWLFRGNYFEDSILNLYVNQLREQGATVEIDTEFHNLFDREPLPSIPWLQGNIDLSLIINGKRQLTDIKAPSEASLKQSLNYGYPFDYLVQLNAYKLYAKEKMKIKGVDLPVDSMALALMNFSQMKVHTLPVEMSPELTDDIITIGNNYWNNYVMQGKLPVSDFDMDSIKLPSHLPESVIKASQELAAVKLLSTKIISYKEELSEKFNTLISAENLPKGEAFEVPTGIASIKAKEDLVVLDEDKLWKLLSSYNIGKDDLMKGGKADIKLAVKTIQLLHKDNPLIPIEMVISKQLKFDVAVTRKKSGVQCEQKETSSNTMNKAIELIKNKVTETQEQLLPDVTQELKSKKEVSKRIKKATTKKATKEKEDTLVNLSNMNMI